MYTYYQFHFQGYSRFQIKLGHKNIESDVARIRACHGVLTPGDILVGDANGGNGS